MATPINPFAALTLIAAPAVLTNSSSVLTMGTGNRLGRAVDRVRQLTAELEHPEALSEAAAQIRLAELHTIQRRMLLLIRALRAFYLAIGAFAGASLLSLIGAVLASAAGEWAHLLMRALEAVAIVFGTVAVGALVRGSLLLVRETQIAVTAMEERAAWVEETFAAFDRQRHRPSAEAPADRRT
jgi:hypothetical protein